MINDGYTVKSGSITWSITESSVVTPTEEYQKVGVHSFDFQQFKDLTKSLKDPHAAKKQNNNYNNDDTFPYFKLFMLLWPGNWKSQLKQLNSSIATHISNSSKNGTKGRHIGQVTATEWWKFIAIIIAAANCGYGGHRLWDDDHSRAKEGRRLFTKAPDFKRYMTKRRFEDIKAFFPDAFSDVSRSDKESTTYDPWWRVISFFEAFNANRTETVLASFTKTLDEIMCSYRPRTSKYGGLPNISFILRKPKPLGIEFKVTCCAVTGIMLHIEVQRGRDGMAQAHLDNAIHGATAACSLRQVQATKRSSDSPSESGKKNLFYGDSWFASVKTAKLISNQGHSFVGPIKTNHKNFPKAALESKMASWPGGTSMVLNGTTESGVPLLAIGYKYNSRKVLSFIATKDAGSTTPGTPYFAKYPDEFRNVITRPVPWPDVLSNYFENCNIVDSHNQTRQCDLGLETHWVTQSCWFRSITTIIGITVTDAWKAFKHGTRSSNDDKTPVLEFADNLVWELMNYNHELPHIHNKPPLNLSPPTKRARINLETVAALTTTMGPPAITPITATHESTTAITNVAFSNHTQVSAPYDCQKKRTPRRRCKVCSMQTTTLCRQCGVYCCRDSYGMNKEKRCWTIHTQTSQMPSSCLPCT